MWAGYIVIGLPALVLNLLAAVELLTGRSKGIPFIVWIVLLSVIHGAFCTLPSALLFDGVACGDCASESCFGDSGVCALSRTSVFLLHAILFCIAWAMYVTTMDVLNPMRAGGTRASRARFWHGLVPVVVLCVLCGIAFALDAAHQEHFTQQERDFHMTRSAFSCYPRLDASEEFLLV